MLNDRVDDEPLLPRDRRSSMVIHNGARQATIETIPKFEL